MPVQFEKALLPIEVTEIGMSIDANLVQLLKAELPIVDKVEGVAKLTDVKPQARKAEFPIAVMEVGIVIEVKTVQFSKALFPIIPTDEGVENITAVKPEQF